MSNAYITPQLDPTDLPIDLLPEAKQSLAALTPETKVVCMNRGRHELRDTFDGEHYVIPPGPQKFWLSYGAALHFKSRLIMNGTRTLDGNGNQPWLCILGIDPPDQCHMLDSQDETAVRQRVEGLDRSQLDPGRQDVKVVETSAARAGVLGQAAGRRANEVFVGAQAVDPNDVLQPPAEGSIARAEEAAAYAEGYAPTSTGGDAPPTPSIRGMRGTRR